MAPNLSGTADRCADEVGGTSSQSADGVGAAPAYVIAAPSAPTDASIGEPAGAPGADATGTEDPTSGAAKPDEPGIGEPPKKMRAGRRPKPRTTSTATASPSQPNDEPVGMVSCETRKKGGRRPKAQAASAPRIEVPVGQRSALEEASSTNAVVPRRRRRAGAASSPNQKASKRGRPKAASSPLASEAKAAADHAPSKRSRRPKALRASACSKSLALSAGIPRSEAEALIASASFLGATGNVSGESLPSGCTHVIVPDGASALPLRAYFAAASPHVWVVRAEWIFRSLEAGCWLDEADFEATHLGAVRDARLAASRPLDGVSICIWRGTALPHDTLRALAMAAGATIVHSPRVAHYLITDEASQTSTGANREDEEDDATGHIAGPLPPADLPANLPLWLARAFAGNTKPGSDGVWRQPGLPAVAPTKWMLDRICRTSASARVDQDDRALLSAGTSAVGLPAPNAAEMAEAPQPPTSTSRTRSPTRLPLLVSTAMTAKESCDATDTPQDAASVPTPRMGTDTETVLEQGFPMDSTEISRDAGGGPQVEQPATRVEARHGVGDENNCEETDDEDDDGSISEEY